MNHAVARATCAKRATHFVSEHWPYASIAAVVCIVMSVMFYSSREPMEFTGATLISNAMVQPGRPIIIEWGQSWHRSGCDGTSTRTIRTTHGEFRTLEGVDVRPPHTLGHVTRTTAITVPDTIPDGDAMLWTTVKMKCWPWNSTYVVESQKVPFTVRAVKSRGE